MCKNIRSNTYLGFQIFSIFRPYFSIFFHCLSLRCSSICWHSFDRKSRMQSSEIEINLWRLIANAFEGSRYRPWPASFVLHSAYTLISNNRNYITSFYYYYYYFKIIFIVRQIYHIIVSIKSIYISHIVSRILF